MQRLFVLTLVLLSNAAFAEEWIILRKTSGREAGGLPGILVDSASIVILDNGLRRARTKTEWSADLRQLDPSGPPAMMTAIYVVSYDCSKKIEHENSTEFNFDDGSSHTMDGAKTTRWYPFTNKLADPAFDFVCNWKPN